MYNVGFSIKGDNEVDDRDGGDDCGEDDGDGTKPNQYQPLQKHIQL